MIMKLGFVGGAPTLNRMDNNGEAFATVLIVEDDRRTGPRLHTEIAPTLQSFMGTGGGNVPMIYPIQDGRELEKNQNGLGIGDENAPAYTLDRTGGQAVANEQIVRRLTPRECERLQGFPDDWTADQADSNRYKQMGNAVAVPVVQWIIDRMVAND
jgi:DNA (cytosine-5)-methyltransferase 1